MNGGFFMLQVGEKKVGDAILRTQGTLSKCPLNYFRYNYCVGAIFYINEIRRII
jgi:hypothetical protein